MFYYQHHIGDFIRDTARLSDAQCMAYLRMIWAYYDTEKPLPNDPETIAFQIGSSSDLVRQILQHYFVLDGDVWRHGRCDDEIAAYHDRSEKARGSANARWKNAKTMRPHNERNANALKNDANQEPITKNQEPSSSVAKATGADAPLTPQEIIYTYGLTLLVNAGVPDKQARSFFGGLIKAHGGEAVVEKLRDCLRAKPLQPLEWLAAALPPKGAAPKRNKQELLEDSNRAVALRFIENMENQSESI